MSRPSFHKDLKRGHAGEIAFQKLAEANGVLLTRTDGRSGDLLDSSGDKYELKSDSYSMSKTANFFLELYSDVDKGKLGGPAQADAHGCKYFCYFFISDATAFVFDTKDLLLQMASIPDSQKMLREVKNVRWVTTGVTINRGLLKPLHVWKNK